MVNKPKNQGTRYESTIVTLAKVYGLEAERIAEGGSLDLGDIRIYTPDGDWIIEAKHRANLNIHQTVDKANAKAYPRRVAVFWKRSVRKKGNTNRTPAGPDIVAMRIDTFLEAIGGTRP